MAREGLPRALGWLSMGLGVAELFGARRLSQTLGVRRGEPLVRGFGARELLAGVGLLARFKPRPWLWARVAGDVLDLTALGRALREPGVKRGAVFGVLAFVAGSTVLDVYAARTA